VSDAFGKTTFRNCFPGIGGHKNFMSSYRFFPFPLPKVMLVLLTGHKHVQINITRGAPDSRLSNFRTPKIPQLSKNPNSSLFGWQLVMCLFVYFEVFALAISRKLQTGTGISKGLV